MEDESGIMRRYTSKKYNYAPTLGVKSDFEALLQKFTETGTVRFQNFAEIWKEMKFSMYCAGRQTQREVREFVEECLKIAVQFWLPPSSFQVRAGALYLLYGLYYYQITTPKVKICVTPENWRVINEYQTQAREQQHLDIDYVFQKLKLERAFQFAATPSEFNPYDYRDDVESKILPDSLKDDDSLLSELYSNQVLNQLAAVHDQYHKMKVSLTGSEEEPLDMSLNIINNELIQNIYKTLNLHREKQDTAATLPLQSKSEESVPDIEEQQFKSLSLKGALKKKAFNADVGELLGRSGAVIKPPRVTDSIVSLQDPKVNICGRMKGRAPKIDLYGRDEEVVVGPAVPASLGVIDMPSFESILRNMNQDMLKAEEKSPSRKRKKKDQKDTGVKKKESKSPSSDEEFISLEMTADTDKDISVTVSKKAKSKAKRKGAKGLLEDNDIDTSSDSPKSIAKSPNKKTKEKPRKSSPSKIDKRVKSTDVSPIKSPRRTARMSIGNTDATVLKKEREKSGTPKKKSGVKIERIEGDYDDSNVKKRGQKKSQQRINEESKEKSNLEDQTIGNKNTQGKTGKLPLRKSVKNKKDSSFDTDLKSSEMKSDSKKSNSKRKMKTTVVEDTGGKKRRKEGTEEHSNTSVGKTELEDSAKRGKVTPKVEEYVQAEMKLVQSTLSKQKDKGTKRANKIAKESEPSAQERLNKRITQRIKEKRKHST